MEKIQERIDFEFLKKLSLGELEGEKDELLSEAVILTESVEELLDNGFNYVLSPKGAGKSAIFKCYQQKIFPEEKVNYNKCHFLCINEAFGFEHEYLDSKRFKENLGYRTYTLSWALYILMKIINEIVTNQKLNNFQNFIKLKEELKKVEDFKDKFELYNFIDMIEQFNMSIIYDVNGQQFKIAPKIKINKPKKTISLNELYKVINTYLTENEIKLYILIDRVDNFVKLENYKIQKNYLQGLHEAVEEITYSNNIKPLLFLRTDLFNSLQSVEFDKIRSRVLNLSWHDHEILLFILRRLFTNKYIYTNFWNQFERIVVDEAQEKRTNWDKILYKLHLKKIDIKTNFSYRACFRFLKIFFPEKITHKNESFIEEIIDFDKWLLIHFKDENNYINPRCLIRFFNLLFKEQYNTYKNDPKLINESEFLFHKKMKKGDIALNVFMEEVIQNTYETIQKEEVKNVYMLLKNQNEQELFKIINLISINKMIFDSNEIYYKMFNLTTDEFSRILKYLEILGVIKHIGNQQYITSKIYRTRLELLE